MEIYREVKTPKQEVALRRLPCSFPFLPVLLRLVFLHFLFLLRHP